MKHALRPPPDPDPYEKRPQGGQPLAAAVTSTSSDTSTLMTQDGWHKSDMDTDIEALMDFKVKDPVLPRSPGRAKLQVCPVCGHEVFSGLALIDHLKQLHKNIKSYKCEQCTSAFNNLRALSSHVLVVHRKKQVK